MKVQFCLCHALDPLLISYVLEHMHTKDGGPGTRLYHLMLAVILVNLKGGPLFFKLDYTVTRMWTEWQTITYILLIASQQHKLSLWPCTT